MFLRDYADIPNMETVKIENWEIVYSPPNPYTAPECCPPYLYGQVYGHPRFEDGKFISTSMIVDAYGNHVKTKNTEYVLGKPSDKYAEWCKKHCPHIDLSNPFKHEGK